MVLSRDNFHRAGIQDAFAHFEMVEQLRHVAEVDGHWVTLFSRIGADHITGRDRWIGWTDMQCRNRVLPRCTQPEKDIRLSPCRLNLSLPGQPPPWFEELEKMQCRPLSGNEQTRLFFPRTAKDGLRMQLPLKPVVHNRS